MVNSLRKIYHHDNSDTASNSPITSCTSTLALLMRCTNDKSCVTSIAFLSSSNFPLLAQHLRHTDRLEALHGNTHQMHLPLGQHLIRSEERRVGKECRSRWSPYH